MSDTSELLTALRLDVLEKTIERCRDSYGILQKRRWKYSQNSGTCLAWNIDLNKEDREGKTGEYKVCPRFDELWAAWMDENEKQLEYWPEHCLDFVGDKKHRSWNWNEGLEPVDGIDISKCDYELWQGGYYGEELVLTAWEGQACSESMLEDRMNERIEEAELCIEGCRNYFMCDPESECKDCNIECNDDIDELDVDAHIENIEDFIEYLQEIRVFCESLDKFNMTEAWNYECNYRRNAEEESWRKGDFSNMDNVEEFLEDHPDLPVSVRKAIWKYLCYDPNQLELALKEAT